MNPEEGQTCVARRELGPGSIGIMCGYMRRGVTGPEDMYAWKLMKGIWVTPTEPGAMKPNPRVNPLAFMNEDLRRSPQGQEVEVKGNFILDLNLTMPVRAGTQIRVCYGRDWGLLPYEPIIMNRTVALMRLLEELAPRRTGGDVQDATIDLMRCVMEDIVDGRIRRTHLHEEDTDDHTDGLSVARVCSAVAEGVWKVDSWDMVPLAATGLGGMRVVADTIPRIKLPLLIREIRTMYGLCTGKGTTSSAPTTFQKTKWAVMTGYMAKQKMPCDEISADLDRMEEWCGDLTHQAE